MIAILDIDGTLVDSNYHHVISWHRAFRDVGLTVPLWKVHRAMGIGGDRIIEHLCGEGVEEQFGDKIREREGEHYFGDGLIKEVRPLEGARELAAELGRRGHEVVMASSAKEEEVEHYLDLLEARDVADSWTTSGDVEEAKPAPDLVQVALKKAGGEPGDALLVGDSVWDVEAAGRAGVRTVALMTGGFSEDELLEAGAEAVFGSMPELMDRLDELFPAGEG